MAKKRFIRFVKGEEGEVKEPSRITKAKGFISRIALSLSQSGYRVNKSHVLLLFVAYLIVFFLIGYFILGSMFLKVDKNITAKDLSADPKYSFLKEYLVDSGIKSSGILEEFSSYLRNNEELRSYFEHETLKPNIEKVKLIINNEISELINNKLNLKLEELPAFDLDYLLIYNSLVIGNTIKDKFGSFVNIVTNNFYRYLTLEPFETFFIEKSNFGKQQFLFRFAFGLIVAFQGYLLFLAFLYGYLEQLSLNRLRSQIPQWLQMLTNSMQAGNSISQAIDFSRSKLKSAPISYILEQIYSRYETFRNLEQALAPLSEWEDKIPELKNVTSSLIIQEKRGGNLVPVLYALNNLFSKKMFVKQKIESIASEATGQLRIIFVMFFGIIFLFEFFMKYFESPISPIYMFFSRGGNFSGFLNLIIIHSLISFFAFLLYKGGEKAVVKEMNF